MKGWRGWKWISEIDKANRVYLYRRGEKIQLDLIDRPKPAGATELVAHCSEKDWNLPDMANTHLLNMPKVRAFANSNI